MSKKPNFTLVMSTLALVLLMCKSISASQSEKEMTPTTPPISRNVKDFDIHLSKGSGGDQREHWWHRDYLELLAKRANLKEVQEALDVGCGTGHWTRIISSLLNPGTPVIGIDTEQKFVTEAEQVTKTKLPDANISYQKGDAYALSFKDQSFGLVTCQLVFMHLADVEKALTEMVRVLRPGGVLVLVEPNKTICGLFKTDTILDGFSVEEHLDLLKLYLLCGKGKVEKGNGFEDIGPRLPGILAKFPDMQIDIYNSDKVFNLLPGHESERERLQIKFMSDILKQNSFGTYTKERAHEYFFQASSGTDEEKQKEFNRLWSTVEKYNKGFFEQAENKTLTGTFGALFMVTIARKK